MATAREQPGLSGLSISCSWDTGAGAAHARLRQSDGGFSQM